MICNLDRVLAIAGSEQGGRAGHFCRPDCSKAGLQSDVDTSCDQRAPRFGGQEVTRRARPPLPWRLPKRTWLTNLRRAWHEQAEDNIGRLAAGISFFGFLALVPMLGALVLRYRLIASPETVVRNMRHLADAMLVGAAKLVGEQLTSAVSVSTGKKGAGLLIALAVALFGARSAAGGVIDALNIAYKQPDRLGFVAARS